MRHWLLKEEPTHYSYARLEQDRQTVWSGVRNPLAQRHLAAMRRGDEGLFYHTGNERACVGIVRIASDPAPESPQPPLYWQVRVEPVRRLARPVTLAEIRAAALPPFDLVRLPRLSVVPVPTPVWKWILARSAVPVSPPESTYGTNRGSRSSSAAARARRRSGT